MFSQNTALSPRTHRIPSRLPFLLLGFMLPYHLLPPTGKALPPRLSGLLRSDKPTTGSPQAKSDLHQQLTSLCLHNPYWNDFHLLNYFTKRKVPMTITDLHRLKAECGLDKRETISNLLMRLSSQGDLKLNNWQSSFVGKVNPEFRDRDLRPKQPGELLVYECLFGRNIGDIGRVYIHLFVDLFNGYTFGGLSQRRTVSDGLDTLTEDILPIYFAHDLAVQTVLHSAREKDTIKEIKELETVETFSHLDLKWQHTRREFGIIEKFAKSLLRDEFFERTGDTATCLADLQGPFIQWLIKYNVTNRLLQHRNPN